MDPSAANSTGELIIGLGILLNLALGIISIVATFRRKPPLETELYKEYVTRADHAADVDRGAANLAAAAQRWEAAITSMRAEHVRVLESLRDEDRAVHGEIFGELRKLASTIAANQGEVSKALGRLEGSVANVCRLRTGGKCPP
jgi:hypothetical protein